MTNRGKTIQIIILGDGAVGKTSMITQYCNKTFSEEHITTLGLDFAQKKFQSKNGNEYTVKVWDTAGQERFKTLTYAFYKRADGVIIAYDTTEKKSFENTTTWMDSIKEHADSHVPKILVANKIDLEDDRKVSSE